MTAPQIAHTGPLASDVQKVERRGLVDERWIAYPVLLWLVGFGAHLMSGPRRSGARG